jgi:hypothetical protein
VFDRQFFYAGSLWTAAPIADCYVNPETGTGPRRYPVLFRTEGRPPIIGYTTDAPAQMADRNLLGALQRELHGHGPLDRLRDLYVVPGTLAEPALVYRCATCGRKFFRRLDEGHLFDQATGRRHDQSGYPRCLRPESIGAT